MSTGSPFPAVTVYMEDENVNAFRKTDPRPRLHCLTPYDLQEMTFNLNPKLRARLVEEEKAEEKADVENNEENSKGQTGQGPPE